jgi:nicotinamide-nucleotide amidase
MRAEQKLSNLLKEKKLTLALVESVTCGLATHKLGTISNTSDILKGSVIAYDEGIKIKVMNISKALLKKYSAESQEVTDALAKSIYKMMNADLSVAITGLAAPGGSETKNKPVGTIFISVLFRNKVHRLKSLYRGSPLSIKLKACRDLYSFTYDVIVGNL